MNKTIAEGMKKVLIVTVASCAAWAWAASTPVPIANLTEKWDVASGWQSGVVDVGSPSWTWNGSALQISFPGQSTTSIPEPGGARVFAIDTTGGGRFSGNYAANGIYQVSFTLQGWVTGEGVFFYFKARNGHEWRLSLNPPSVGDVQAVTIPLEYSKAWQLQGANEEKSAALMAHDLTDVIEVGVLAFKNGPTAEVLIVDNFKLAGPWNGNFTDGIADSWRVEHGITGEDPDKDGVSNYAEFMAGTDPNDAKSFFVIEIGKNAQGQTALTWKHEYGRVFKLVKTTDLVSENQVQETVKTLQSVAPKNEVVVDEQGPGPYFYKVEITQ